MEKCYICDAEKRRTVKGKLLDGRIVTYCVGCWKVLQDGLKIWRLKKRLQEKTLPNKPRRHKSKVSIEKILSNNRSTFSCQNCNTAWPNTRSSLDYIQTNHNQGNPGHMVVDVSESK